MKFIIDFLISFAMVAVALAIINRVAFIRDLVYGKATAA